jgi:hypothetical protein
MRFPVLLIVILVAGFVVKGVAGLIVAAVLLAAGYLLSLRLNPRVRHGACNGTGRATGWIYTWTWHRCAGCVGRGQVIRRGAQQWGAQHVRDEAVRQAAAAADAKQRSAWR